MQDAYKKTSLLCVLLNVWQCGLICKSCRNKGLTKKDLIDMEESHSAENITNKLSR